MVVSILLLTVLYMITNVSPESYCNIPKECEIIRINEREIPNKRTYVKCLITDGTRLRFNRSSESINCKQFNTTDLERQIIIKSKYERSTKLEKGMIDLSDITTYLKPLINNLRINFNFINGFDLNLLDDESTNIEKYNKRNIMITLNYCTFDFFYLNRKLTTCQDFIDVTERNSTDPRSIFQLISKMSKYNLVISLTESKTRLCPLVFKNFIINEITLMGEDTFYSKRLLTFTNDSFKDLNSKITYINFGIQNAELGTNFLHPDVFKEVKGIQVRSQLKKNSSESIHRAK